MQKVGIVINCNSNQIYYNIVVAEWHGVREIFRERLTERERESERERENDRKSNGSNKFRGEMNNKQQLNKE